MGCHGDQECCLVVGFHFRAEDVVEALHRLGRSTVFRKCLDLLVLGPDCYTKSWDWEEEAREDSYP